MPGANHGADSTQVRVRLKLSSTDHRPSSPSRGLVPWRHRPFWSELASEFAFAYPGDRVPRQTSCDRNEQPRMAGPLEDHPAPKVENWERRLKPRSCGQTV